MFNYDCTEREKKSVSQNVYFPYMCLHTYLGLLWQWKNVTNTVWFQDFLRRSSPDYSSLFGRPEHTKCDFAAQLAGFIASLIIDVPSQAHWITELAKFDFTGSQGHLVASVPGIYVQNPPYFGADHCLSVSSYNIFQSNNCVD